MKTSLKITMVILFFLVTLSSCEKESTLKDPTVTAKSFGKFQIQFAHSMGADSLILNSDQYVNEAGNHFEVNELMYFISDVQLHLHNGAKKMIDDQTAVHFVDLSMPETLKWNVFDSIPQGAIDSITFIFGLSPARNQSFAFVNPPESNMAWPDVLGGGYHYMMLNGKWTDLAKTEQFFNFHMGIGQRYSDTISYNTESITGIVHNNFAVTLATPGLIIDTIQTAKLCLNMDVMSWFTTPYAWDFNYWGGGIMQNQRALNTAKENGFDVFTVKSIAMEGNPYRNINWVSNSENYKKSILFCDFTRKLQAKKKSCCKGGK